MSGVVAQGVLQAQPQRRLPVRQREGVSVLLRVSRRVEPTERHGAVVYGQDLVLQVASGASQLAAVPS